ncbi:hypothetical protein O3P69_009187 [Scylla paramamosain]|uniref:Solute carrier organic anion transporter family member n=1 Tax=Scylla paramamosain TaxID=85552 RepID=A0AAW0TBB9_SCYPA
MVRWPPPGGAAARHHHHLSLTPPPSPTPTSGEGGGTCGPTTFASTPGSSTPYVAPSSPLVRPAGTPDPATPPPSRHAPALESSLPAAANGTPSRVGVAADAPAPSSTNGDLNHRRPNGVTLRAVQQQQPQPQQQQQQQQAATEGEEEEHEAEEAKCDEGEGEGEEGAVCRAEGGAESGEDGSARCGLGRWCSPRWAQRLATKQVFLAVFCATSVLQGMYYTYYVSVLTTVERLFQFKSKTTGVIMSATEMGQIGGALLLAYYGGQGHRPKWIGWGMLLFSFCAFLSSLPHFLYGEELLRKHLETTPTRDSPLATANLCRHGGGVLSHSPAPPNTTLHADSLLLDPASVPGAPRDCDSPEGETHVVLALFFLSLLGIGIGQTAAYNLGIPYIDDNIANTETPIYFAVTSGVRILGPALGFVLGFLCTRLYLEPLVDPGIEPTDQRWIGAWWLGLVVVSVALLLTSFAMFAFPRRLPQSPRRRHLKLGAPAPLPPPPRRNASLTDFVRAVWRLLRNRILILRTASNVLHTLPIAGLYTFLPKYLQSQFRLPVHTAALVSGIGGILVMGVGIFASGFYIWHVKPSPRAVAGWIAISALVYAVGMVILMFVGCPPEDFVGLVDGEDGKQFRPVCNLTCGECDLNTFAPVCDPQGRAYFSSCHLGCTNATLMHHSNQLVFSECECLAAGETVVLKLCGMKCDNFKWYVIIFSAFVLVHSTSEVGGMLLTLRCVDSKDKAMALGLISVAIGLLSNVPCPIIYGAVVDSACIQWKETCRRAGACQLYDSDSFRMFFHGMTGAVMLLAFLVDVCVWCLAGNISFEDPTSSTSLHLSPSTPDAPCTFSAPATASTSQESTPILPQCEVEMSFVQVKDAGVECVDVTKDVM